MFASLDYWVMVISEGLVSLNERDRAVLSSIRRLNSGVVSMYVCTARAETVINLLRDDYTPLERKNREFTGLVLQFEKLFEGHPFKNAFFACIVHVMLALYFAGSFSFNSLLRILARLLAEGKISERTYIEIALQLLYGGVSRADVEIMMEYIIESVVDDMTYNGPPLLPK